MHVSKRATFILSLSHLGNLYLSRLFSLLPFQLCTYPTHLILTFSFSLLFSGVDAVRIGHWQFSSQFSLRILSFVVHLRSRWSFLYSRVRKIGDLLV
ncbi:hypothetical protein BJX99DRAFT_50210 [Aspergillus californicus]